MTTAEWNVAIRDQAITLAEVTMPALSLWGNSAAAMGGGLSARNANINARQPSPRAGEAPKKKTVAVASRYLSPKPLATAPR